MRILFFICCIPYFALASLPEQAALVVGKCGMMSERNLSSDIRKVIYAGEVVEILEKHKEEELDKDQNQTFFWYFVKIKSGESGWVFGNNIAKMVDSSALNHILPPNIDKKRLDLGGIFGEAIRWFARVEGHDAGVYSKGSYSETYLVLTTASGKSIFYSCAQSSSEGQTVLHNFKEMDVNGDDQPELILDMESVEKDQSYGQRWVEVLSIQTGFFQKIFSTELSLYTYDGMPTPTVSKFVEFDPQSIRIEYVEWLECPESQTSTAKEGFSYCLQNVTRFLTWDTYTNEYVELYDALRQPPNAKTIQGTVPIHSQPSHFDTPSSALFLGEMVQTVQLYEKIVIHLGKKTMQPWFYIVTADGRSGYVQAKYLELVDFAHAELLNTFLKEKPISHYGWRADMDFVRFINN